MGRGTRAAGGVNRLRIAAAWCAALALWSVQAEPIRTEAGLVEGTTLASGVRAWLGVPFAAPPVRELRWRPPQPVRPWSGVQHAERQAPMCLQPVRSRTMNHYFGNEATSEDCLYLNVWAPPVGDVPSRAANLPVIVWIYGGGFNVGSASMANYSGEGLAQSGVVRVNLAYRLGALGFLAHTELTRESDYGGSGNYGLMDLVAGLQWVQRNIAAFGGDPANVTIVGQSAGSMAAALLQASPPARGLFHKVVGMSGSPFSEPLTAVTLEQGEAAGLALQRALGAQSLEQLRDIGGDRIVGTTVAREPIVLDGRYVIGAAKAFEARQHSDVPIMLGFTRDESFRSLGAVTTVADLEAAVRQMFPSTASAVLAAYRAGDAASSVRAAADIARDSSVGSQMANWARAQVKFGRSPAYAYFFTRRQPYAPGITFIDHDPATAGAYHSGEIPYFLRTRESLNLFRQTRIWEDVDVKLEEDMAALLVSFARDGKPRSPRVREWPVFEPTRPRVVSLGVDIDVIDWPHYESLPLLATPRAIAAPQSARPRARD
jgi:para-nitrobenzyl esterase